MLTAVMMIIVLIMMEIMGIVLLFIRKEELSNCKLTKWIDRTFVGAVLVEEKQHQIHHMFEMKATGTQKSLTRERLEIFFELNDEEQTERFNYIELLVIGKILDIFTYSLISFPLAMGTYITIRWIMG